MGEEEQRKNLIRFVDAALEENLDCWGAAEVPRLVAELMTLMACFAEDR